jgi:hypothetical protein
MLHGINHFMIFGIYRYNVPVWGKEHAYIFLLERSLS